MPFIAFTMTPPDWRFAEPKKLLHSHPANPHLSTPHEPSTWLPSPQLAPVTPTQNKDMWMRDENPAHYQLPGTSPDLYAHSLSDDFLGQS